MFSRFIFIFALIGLIGWFVLKKPSNSDSVMTIGILQTASHPALDQARDGFMAEMNRLSTQKIDFVVQNAEGNLTQAQSIAENFHSRKKISAIFAIGTPAVQAAARAEKEKPIFIAAVSDPLSLGIIHPNTNICGTTDQVNTDAQADLILQLIPNVQTVALIYNPSENNSQIMVKKIQASLEKKGLKHHTVGAHSAEELSQVVRAACAKGEAILVPNDNLVASNITLVVKETALRQCPLFVSDIALVEKGAFAAQGAEYKDMGKETAEMAHKVLFLGMTPEAAGITNPTNPKTVINNTVAENLHINLPVETIKE
ncbi:MAG: ABC transporter substrate-binding protein [Chlamydiales bacterium]|nr:ABC transporter substrate-binding protein [Chlamydiales bacterium]